MHRRLVTQALSVAPWVGLTGAAQAQAPSPKPASTPASTPTAELRVGPGRAVSRLAEAARLARPGMVVRVDAGDYVNDVAVWPQDDLQLLAEGGRVRVISPQQSAEGKALFVMRGRGQVVQGFDFVGCQVGDGNGCGIRAESGSLLLRDCSFSRGQMGVLTSNDAELRLTVEGCEFSQTNAGPERPAHQLYAGRIAQLTVRHCYGHGGHIGHLIKSRARVNHILYNRLTDEAGGRASYELEFPEGGLAVVVGNLIQQAATTENIHLIAFGAEPYRHPNSALWLAHNTLVNDVARGGQLLRVHPGASDIHAVNNLLVNASELRVEPWAERLKARIKGEAPSGDIRWDLRHNLTATWEDFQLAVRQDYRLRGDLRRWQVPDPGAGPEGLALRPAFQYQHPRALRPLSPTAPLIAGALQGV